MLVTISFVACKKNDIVDKPETTATDVTKAYKDIASVIISTAKNNNNFRNVAYSECNKQKYGDYYVKLDELIALNATHKYWDATTVNKLLDFQKQIKSSKRNDVIIFIPSVENYPISGQSNRVAARANVYDEAIAVIGDEYQARSQTCPGYIVETDGNFTFYQTIDEEFAWENDVWVIGEEEGDPSNDTTLARPTSARFNGQPEYGGIIQVTDFSQIEPWITGKLELKYTVYSASGTVIKDREFPKVKRKDIKAPTWKNFGEFLANWNTPNIGNWMIEGWVEQDDRGGKKSSTTFSTSFPAACTGCPTTSISTTIKYVDYDMGRTIIQFSDAISQVYNISYANIKRSN